MIIEQYTGNYEGNFEKIWVDWLKNTMGIEPQIEDIERYETLFNPLSKKVEWLFMPQMSMIALE